MLDLHVNCIISTVDEYVQCDRHVCLAAYDNNAKYRYTSVCGDIVDCSKFICGIYTSIVV